MATDIEFMLVDVTADDAAFAATTSSTSARTGAGFEYRVSTGCVDGASYSDMITVRLFGRTAEGQSVAIMVSGFQPQLFMRPDAVRSAIRTESRRQLSTQMMRGSWFRGWTPGDVAGAPREMDFQRVSFRSRRDFSQFARSHEAHVYESRVSVITQFAQALGLTVTGWVRARAVVQSADERATHCNIEAHCKIGDVVSVSGRNSDIAPIRVLSYDIECVTEGGFPQAARLHDAVTLIAAVVHVYGSDLSTAKRVLFSAGPCDLIEDVDVRAFTDENDMLRGFRDYVVVEADPDVITGYNIDGFDNRYMYTRASTRCASFAYLSRVVWEAAKLNEKTQRSNQSGSQALALLQMQGRVTIDMHAVMRQTKESNYSLSNMAKKYLEDDKVHLDADADAGMGSDPDAHYRIMNELCLSGDGAQRAQVGRYCVKDAQLALELMLIRDTVPSQISMSRLTSTPWQSISVGGQQQRVFNQLYRAAKAAKPMRVLNAAVSRTDDESDAGDKYDGAEVLEPISGFYDCVVSTLDYASLYPSIMMYFNLCQSTLVEDATLRARLCQLMKPTYEDAKIIQIRALNATEYELNTLECSTPGSLERGLCEWGALAGSSFNGFFVGGSMGWVFFCSSQVGIVPSVLRALLTERKKTKRKMEAAFERATILKEKGVAHKKEYDAELTRVAILNSDQLSMKVAANSAYGFMGAQACGLLPCIEIAIITCMVGRFMIIWTKKIVEAMYPGIAQVVYGDTDSVFVNFTDKPELHIGFERGDKMAEEVTRIVKISVLENEKSYYPLLLAKKKRYAGQMFEKVAGEIKQTKLDYKGFDLVRRDNFEFARRMTTDFLKKLLHDIDLQGSLKVIEHHLQLFRMFNLPISDFVQSKRLGDNYADADKLIHPNVVRKMRERNPGSEPQVGDRVPFVFCRLENADAKACEKADDPVYVEKNKLPLDYEHYLRAIMSQLGALLAPCDPDPGRHFAHTMAIVQAFHMKTRNLTTYGGIRVGQDEGGEVVVRKLGGLIASSPTRKRARKRPKK